MTLVALLFLIALQSLLTLIVLYQLAIIVLGFLTKERLARSLCARTRFAIIIPAHNEECTVAQAVSSLLESDYAAKLRDIFVIADNCTDRTAEVARQSGALCLERTDPKKGKGYTLQWTLERIPKDRYDAFVFLDADSTVAPSFLYHLDHDIQGGKKAIQGYEVTKNPGDTWLTRLSDVSDFFQFQYYYRARSKLGLSCRLLGNGMCFSREIIANFGWDAFSIGEDGEYYMKLILGEYIVHYNPMARFFSERAVDFTQGKPQRLRWMTGKAEVVRRYIPVLVVNALRKADIRQLDAAVEFLLPSQSMLLGMIFLAFSFQYWVNMESLLVWLIGIVIVIASYIGVAVVTGGFPYETYKAMLFAPVYVLWKIWLRVQSIFRKERRWVKTERRATYNSSGIDRR
ncbi:MAG: glycosyltransferase family 2 protein [Candidatus Methylomirabilales bacterium]